MGNQLENTRILWTIYILRAIYGAGLRRRTIISLSEQCTILENHPHNEAKKSLSLFQRLCGEEQCLFLSVIGCRSVDPFGHGLMIPYLLSLSGIEQMVIGRINTAIKNEMKEAHQLHFRWAQIWDAVGFLVAWIDLWVSLAKIFVSKSHGKTFEVHTCCTCIIFTSSPDS